MLFCCSKAGGVSVLEGSTVTIVNSIIRGNTADQGGGMYVASGTVNVYGTTFSSNTITSLGNGPDIYNDVGTVSVYSSCSAGESSDWGGELQTNGPILSTPKSFLPCSPCVAGNWQDQIRQNECVDCIADTFSEIVGSTNSSNCNNCEQKQRATGNNQASECGEEQSVDTRKRRAGRRSVTLLPDRRSNTP